MGEGEVSLEEEIRKYAQEHGSREAARKFKISTATVTLVRQGKSLEEARKIIAEKIAQGKSKMKQNEQKSKKQGESSQPMHATPDIPGLELGSLESEITPEGYLVTQKLRIPVNVLAWFQFAKSRGYDADLGTFIGECVEGFFENVYRMKLMIVRR